MTWPFTMQHTNAIQLNPKKIVKLDMEEKNHFQQHCNADDCFSGKVSQTVVVIIMCCLPYYPVTCCLLWLVFVLCCFVFP